MYVLGDAKYNLGVPFAIVAAPNVSNVNFAHPTVDTTSVFVIPCATSSVVPFFWGEGSSFKILALNHATCTRVCATSIRRRER